MAIESMIILLLIVLIAIGLQTVGVILMSALLIAPAAAARQWTNQVTPMALCAAAIGGISSMVGTYISYHTAQVPTGPILVILVSAIAFLSLSLTPSRTKTG